MDSSFVCCPECWIKGKATPMELISKTIVFCPHHGETTFSHFVSRMNELKEEMKNIDMRIMHGALIK